MSKEQPVITLQIRVKTNAMRDQLTKENEA